MEKFYKNKSLFWASASLLSMLLVLIIIAGLSSGFTGLSDNIQSLAYSLTVTIPLFLVVLLANKYSAKTNSPPVIVSEKVALTE